MEEDLKKAIEKIPNKRILQIAMDEENIFNSILNNKKYPQIYLLKIFYKSKPYLFSFNSARACPKNNFIFSFYE